MRKAAAVSVICLGFWVVQGCGKPTGLISSSPGIDSGSGKPVGGAITFGWINTNILQPKCVDCHAYRKPFMTTYSDFMASGDIVKGQPGKSQLYIQTASGKMPKNAAPLSTTELRAIYEWIQNGAPDDTPGP